MMPRSLTCALKSLSLIGAMIVSLPADAASPCRIVVVDQDNGWPVPLVELRTVHGLRFVSDNAGCIAMDAEELLDREVWFNVHGHGYQRLADGFGYRGVRLTPRAGETLTVQVQRTMPAMRLGRLTGSGLLADSKRFDSTPQDLPEAVESGIVGCDSVQTVVHAGKRYWVWGDTQRPNYPLGIFNASGATSVAQPLRQAMPPIVLPFKYFRDAQQRPRGIATIEGEGPTWLFNLASVADQAEQTHLVCMYVKVKPPLTAYRVGLAKWDPATETFQSRRVIWEVSDKETRAPDYPHGHATHWTDPQGRRWLLLGNPFPTHQIPDDFESFLDPTTWQTVPPPQELIAGDGQTRVKPHSGSIVWNAYRQRWIAIFTQAFGQPSAFGEVWYGEALSPLGPWGPVVKVLTHDNYTFYNPRVHEDLTTEQDPRVLLFEGTYTTLFTSAKNSAALAPEVPQPTPRYEYNQVLYRLDLDHESLSTAR